MCPDMRKRNTLNVDEQNHVKRAYLDVPLAYKLDRNYVDENIGTLAIYMVLLVDVQHVVTFPHVGTHCSSYWAHFDSVMSSGQYKSLVGLLF